MAVNLKQKDICKKTGLAQPWLSEIERGRKAVTIDSMSKLAECIDVPVWKLLLPS